MQKCEFCKKEYDIKETIRIYGDTWWVGICCSARCYTKRCHAKSQIANTQLEPNQQRQVSLV